VGWFEVTKDHSSSRSVYEEYMKYQREKQTQLAKEAEQMGTGTNRRRVSLKDRQSGEIEKHVSNCRIVTNEVDLLKNRWKMQDDSLSEAQAHSKACLELDSLVKMVSNRGHYSLNLARDFCAGEEKLRNDLKKHEAEERAQEEERAGDDEEVDETDSE
jgi:hypothetical protein